MPNTIPSPNMNLPVPVVGTDPGPDWANNVNASLSAIDSHNHSSGQGVQIGPAGMNINADLSFNGNNATTLRTSRYSSQSGTLSGSTDLDCTYVVNGDLYYNDGSGNQVRITQSGSVTGATGTITGLPSGTASASFSAGTFSFQSATNTPATMSVGPLVMGAASASPHTVTLSAGTMAADYSIVWPTSAPTTAQTLVSDSSGNLSWSAAGFLPIGSVIATFPNLTGAYTTSATTAADSRGFVLCVGQTISDGTSPMNGQVVPHINNSVFLLGSTTAGTAGGTLGGVGAHTHTFTSGATVPTEDHTHIFSHTHQWSLFDIQQTPTAIFSLGSSQPSKTSITTSDQVIISSNHNLSGSSGSNYVMSQFVFNSNEYTTGVLSAPGSTSGSTAATAGASALTTVSGTTDSTGDASFLPPYISAVYLMRIK